MKRKQVYQFCQANPTNKSIVIPTCEFKLKMEVITLGDTLFIVVLIWNIEHCSLVMIPSKTISTCTQDSATHPIKCTGSKTTTIRNIGTKVIDFSLFKYYSCKVLSINYIQALYNQSPKLLNQHTSRKQIFFLK